jgi:hypothetical protein
MKRVELERQAIVKALEETPNKNITLAAKQLGASRRTLQSRMRDYDMPVGESGRPRHLLPKQRTSGFAEVLPGLAVVGVVVGLGWLLLRDSDSRPHIVGDQSSNPYLIGTDILGS